ncbi:MAG: VanZ family protein [Coriobacteriia bacterium]|jgi:VanZ family protein|nr:VanZ family protein [Coriobacteriia bacterium]
MAVIFGFSSLHGSAVPSAGGYWAHFAVYTVLGGLLFIAFTFETADPGHALALAVLVASAYGVTDELHQVFVPGRLPEVADWGMDTLGALLGALIMFIVLRRIARNRAARASAPRASS